MSLIVVDEERKTAKQIFAEARDIVNGMAIAKGIEPLQASSPVFIIAWEHWEAAFLIASVRADDMEIEDWVFNHYCLKQCKRFIGMCLQAYMKKP